VGVHEEASEFLTWPTERLMALPSQSAEDHLPGPRGRHTRIVWHDVVDENVHRIVVAKYDNWIGTVQVAGILVSPDGARRMAGPKELYDF